MESRKDALRMVLKFDDIITDPYMLQQGYIYRDGFIFTFGQDNPAVFNRIVIRKPERARDFSNNLGFSYRSFEEHIELIDEHKIEKAHIICDNLDFIVNCPSLKDVIISPSFDADESFDYSPLYKMPNLKTVYCKTEYGDFEQYSVTLDCLAIKNLENISVDTNGCIGYEKVTTLKKLWLANHKRIVDFNDVSSSQMLQDVTLLNCSIKSLSGIYKCPKLHSLSLWNNRKLTDISELNSISSSLIELSIESCSKIEDFSVLQHLNNLQILHLSGNNIIPDLSFLKHMKNLKIFTFTVNVLDGNLDKCKSIPYVSCKNRKHYNLKDIDLPKNLSGDRR